MVSYDIIRYAMVPYIGYHVISYGIIWCHMVSYGIIRYHTVSYGIIRYHLVSYVIIHTVPYGIKLFKCGAY